MGDRPADRVGGCLPSAAASKGEGAHGDSPQAGLARQPPPPVAAGGVPTTPSWGAGFCRERTLGPGPGPRVRVAPSSCGAVAEKAPIGWLAPQRSCHPPPRGHALCEARSALAPLARSLAGSLRARRPRAEEPERSSRGLWRPLAAARRCAARPPRRRPWSGSWGSWLFTSYARLK